MKILVIGDGLLGSEIVKQTGWDFISRKKDNIDFTNIETYISLMKDYDQIFNCVAYTKTYSDDADLHINTNFKALVPLVMYCNSFDKKLITISTDYIYSNSVEDATENDVPANCNNWYGYSKLLGDGFVRYFSKNFLLIRTMFKPNPYPYDTAVKQIGSFDYVDKIAGLIIELINKDAKGVYNVGTEKKTMLELANQTKNVTKTIRAIHPSMPKNVSTNVEKMKKELE